MQSETCFIEMTLVAVPLPQEKEEAYWDAMRVVAELIRQEINRAQSLDGWTALGGSDEQDGVAHERECSTELVV